MPVKRKFGKIKERPVVSRAVLLVARFNPLVLLKCPAGKKTIKNKKKFWKLEKRLYLCNRLRI